MADLTPFAGMSQEETQKAILYYLAAILDKLPRIDANDRLITNPSEVAPATTPVSGTVTATVANATVTTVTTLTGLSNIGASLRPADAVPMHLANAGSNHLYDRITF
jgi:hypothetical protein